MVLPLPRIRSTARSLRRLGFSPCILCLLSYFLRGLRRHLIDEGVHELHEPAVRLGRPLVGGRLVAVLAQDNRRERLPSARKARSADRGVARAFADDGRERRHGEIEDGGKHGIARPMTGSATHPVLVLVLDC